MALRLRVLSLVLIFLQCAAACSSSHARTNGTITIGSADFPESEVIADVYAEGLQAKGFKVTKKLNMASRDKYFRALEKGRINFFPDYTGATLDYLTGEQSAAKPDSAETYRLLTKELNKRGLSALRFAPAADVDGVVTNRLTADAYHLRTVEDLKPVAAQLAFGGSPNCPMILGCLKGLEEVYGIRFKEFKVLTPGSDLVIGALASNGIQVADLFTTDARIVQQGFVVLAEDRPVVGAENVVPLVRDDTLRLMGHRFEAAVSRISAKLTTAALRQMNAAIVVNQRGSEAVAHGWLVANGLAG